MPMVTACNKKNQEPEIVDNPQEAVLKLNKNVGGLKNLAAGCVAADSVAIFSIQYNEDGTDYGQAYIGNTEVLNGVPYRISVSWD